MAKVAFAAHGGHRALREEERPGASGALLIAEGAKRSSPTPSTRDRLLGVGGGPGALRATCASVTATRMQLK